MSEQRLIDANALKEVFEREKELNPYETLFFDKVIAIIDNAPTVEAISNKEGYEMYNKGYMSGYERGKPERPQGDLADEVWKLYEKYQPYLATRVIEFGNELKELLGKYQKGGKEE